jgi:hypothetical protein
MGGIIMASIISAGTSSGTALNMTADTSGILQLQAGGTTVATIQSTGVNAGIQMGSAFAPAFSAYATTTQTLTSGSQNKITFAGENFDTNNNFASSRFTPSVAGYYFVTSSVYFNNLVNNTGSYTHIYRNGICIATASATGGSTIYPALSISTLTYLNGSTDYVEIYATQTGGVSKDTVIQVVNLYDGVTFSGFLARSA